MTRQRYDVVFVGGGLANGLAAWRLTQSRPDVSWVMLESGDAMGGSKAPRTWSFHASDLEPTEAWAGAFVDYRWPHHDVRFPTLARRMDGAYLSVRSDTFNARLLANLGASIRFGTKVVSVDPGSVRLEDGQVIHAGMVVEGRGFDGGVPFPCAYQKFVGVTLELARPHRLTGPMLMDATVDQHDGFRFVYVLPWTETTLMIEDTYYSDHPGLEEDAIRGRIRRYAEAQGWTILAEGDRERGALPIPLAGDRELVYRSGVAATGVASGRFHPTTGYSFASAVRMADEIAELRELTPTAADRLNAGSLAIWRRGDFFRRLNNMFFRAAEPTERWRVLAQFYGRDEGLIHRFYKGELRTTDRLKLLSGKPPVPLARGLAAFVARVGGTHA